MRGVPRPMRARGGRSTRCCAVLPCQVHVFRKKPRKRYSKHHGVRPQYTALRILEIKFGEEEAEAPEPARLATAE